MKIKHTGAGVQTADDLNAFDERAYTYWEADGTIAVGSPVVHTVATNDNSFNQSGRLVVEGNCNNRGAEQRILGTYQGTIVAKLGASGYSLETVSGLSTDGSTTISTIRLSGWAAFDGDLIEIQSYGAGYALVQGGTNDVDHGDVLTIVEAGRYVQGTNTTTGMGAQVWALCAHTGTFEAAGLVFHRCL